MDDFADGKDRLTNAEAKAFDYEFLHPKATPLSVPAVTDFDWEVLRRNLGEAAAEMSATDYELLAQTLGELMRWVVRLEAGYGNRRDLILKAIGRRAVSLAWVINPALFDGSPTAEALAKRIGCHPVTLQGDARAASRAFGVSNRGQKAGENGLPKRVVSSPRGRLKKPLSRPSRRPVRPTGR